MVSASLPVPYRCGCILLAGGASRRLGTPKQLLQLNGQTLVRRAACAAIDAGFSPVVTVLGSNAEQVSAELHDLSVKTVFNGSWELGMSTSLVAGLSSMVAADPDCCHALVTVCDQVHVSVETLCRLRHRSMEDPERIVAATYSGLPGVPAIFPKAFFPNLLAIRGDKGARGLLQELRDEVVAVEFAEGAVDIDTPEDAQLAGLL